jgi:hypothetical protein
LNTLLAAHGMFSAELACLYQAGGRPGTAHIAGGCWQGEPTGGAADITVRWVVRQSHIRDLCLQSGCEPLRKLADQLNPCVSLSATASRNELKAEPSALISKGNVMADGVSAST